LQSTATPIETLAATIAAGKREVKRVLDGLKSGQAASPSQRSKRTLAESMTADELAELKVGV